MQGIRTNANECVIFGGLVMDCYIRIDAWPQRGQDGIILGESRRVGGCAVNMAVTVSNLGSRAHVISCVGSDEYGVELGNYLDGHGMPSDLILRTNEPSGKCLVFAEPDGERTFLTQKGAEGAFPQELADSVIALNPAAAGVTGYYLLDRDADRVMDCLEELHRNGTKVLFDPSPLAGSVRTDLLERMLKISDIITPNIVETEILGRLLPGTDLYGGRIVVVKSGSSGGVVYDNSGSSAVEFEYKATECVPVDTTGAGDSFAGALIYSMINGTAIRDAVALAAECAARTVQIYGPHGFWKL